MKNVIISTLFAIIAAYLTVQVASNSHAIKTTTKETAYERVMRTGTLRCGYALYAPLIIKDMNTGKLHGVFYDLVNQLGQELDLKVEWVAEVGYGEIEQGFMTNKYDLFCNGAVITPKRAKYAFYTTPIYYQTTMAWVRADDNRFNNDLNKLNSPDVTIAVRDGDVNEMIAQKSFPKAKTIQSPQMVDFTQMLVDVQSKKADVAFFEKSFGEKFLTKNQGTIKIAAPDKPVDVNPVGLMLPLGEDKFKNFIDAALTKLILNGSVKTYFHQNDPDYDLWSTSIPYVHK